MSETTANDQHTTESELCTVSHEHLNTMIWWRTMAKWQNDKKKTSNKFGYYCRWCLVGCALASLLVWLIGLLTLLHANRNSNSASCFCVNTNRVNKIRLLFWLKKKTSYFLVLCFILGSCCELLWKILHYISEL